MISPHCSPMEKARYQTVSARCSTPIEGMDMLYNGYSMMGWECECGETSRDFFCSGDFAWTTAKDHAARAHGRELPRRTSLKQVGSCPTCGHDLSSTARST